MKTKIYIDDVIGAVSFFDEGVTARSIREQLGRASGDLEIHIDSPGGSVFEGHSIYNAIKDYKKGAVTVIIDGVAGSIASVIAFAGDTLPQFRINASMMIHNPMTIALGDASEMRKAATALDTIKETIVAVYEDGVDNDDLDFATLMDDETWFTAKSAIDAGLGVAFEDSDDEAQNILNLDVSAGVSFENLMKDFVAAKQQKTSTVTVSVEPLDREVIRDAIADAISPAPATEEEIEEPETPKFGNRAARLRMLEIDSEVA